MAPSLLGRPGGRRDGRGRIYPAQAGTRGNREWENAEKASRLGLWRSWSRGTMFGMWCANPEGGNGVRGAVHPQHAAYSRTPSRSPPMPRHVGVDAKDADVDANFPSHWFTPRLLSDD